MIEERISLCKMPISIPAQCTFKKTIFIKNTRIKMCTIDKHSMLKDVKPCQFIKSAIIKFEVTEETINPLTQNKE